MVKDLTNKLSGYINKYITNVYPVINRIDVLEIETFNGKLINVNLVIYSDRNTFLNKLYINERVESIMIDPKTNSICQFFFDLPVFENSELPIKEIRKNIKPIIKTIINKKLNNLNIKIILEESFGENGKQNAKEVLN